MGANKPTSQLVVSV